MADQDPICKPTSSSSTTGSFNTSLIPAASSFSDPTFNILPFLCELLKAASDETVDPVLVPPKEYDQSQHVNFSALTGIGDRRFSDGAILSAAFINFLPRIITQMEVGRSGGSQIINNYICDSDGNPIKQSSTLPIMTSVGNGGVNILGYDIPKGLDTTQLMKPVSRQDVFTFVQNYIIQQSQLHADAFIKYLQRHYNPSQGWRYSLHAFKNPPFFYVEIDHMTKGNIDYSVYLKYYDNVQDYVAKKLADINFINSNAAIDLRIGSKFDNNAVCKAFLTPIPNYTKLLNDEDASASNNANAMKFYSATPNQQFSNYSTYSSSIDQSFDIMGFVEASNNQFN
jgi:hypothetical protein